LKLLVGLGNPGIKYALTKHNVGFLAVDRLAGWLNIEVNRSTLRSFVGQGVYAGEKIILAKPQTYMNLSGEAVVALLNWYKLTPAELIVIYDDLDLPPGRLRIRERGSAGGHRGLASVIGQIGCDDFVRVRIGIGRPPVPGPEVINWVLARPIPEDEEKITRVLDIVPKVVEEIIRNGVISAMNKFNGNQMV
jgi:PTH1 family peptidyl-tRNA hydrolase